MKYFSLIALTLLFISSCSNSTVVTSTDNFTKKQECAKLLKDYPYPEKEYANIIDPEIVFSSNRNTCILRYTTYDNSMKISRWIIRDALTNAVLGSTTAFEASQGDKAAQEADKIFKSYSN